MVQVKREPVPFGNFQQSGHESMAGASPLAVNVVADAAGAVHRRPATGPRARGAPLVSEVSPIVGLHSTALGRLFAVDAPAPFSRIYEIAGTSVYNLSELPQTQLLGGRRPVFAETEAMLVIAAGAVPTKVLLSTPAQASPLGGVPASASHVVAHESRLLINDVASRNTVHYSWQASGSSIAGHEDWHIEEDNPDSGGFFLAEARPDPVVALHENTNEIFAFGTTNLQIYTANADSGGFTYLAANAREFGCSAPYSVIKYDQNFAFIDGYRRVVVTDGRDFQVISQDIQQTLDDIVDFSDAFGYRVTLGPVDALCWCSPKDGRTFAYQISSKSWALWMSWDDATNNFSPLLIRCAIRVPETGVVLAGCANIDQMVGTVPTGNVYTLRNDKFVDESVSGKIVARVDTGFLDRGTNGRKLCRALRLTWRGSPGPDTAAFVQWRDDGGPWEHQRQIEIGYGSEVILRSLGVYRRRQWRVTFEGEAELVLVRAEEEFELLAV